MHVITCINPHTESNDLVLILFQGKKICENASKHNKFISRVRTKTGTDHLSSSRRKKTLDTTDDITFCVFENVVIYFEKLWRPGSTKLIEALMCHFQCACMTL